MSAPASKAPAFSASDAAIDGFRVIREHWRLIVGWAVFNLLALVALVVVSVIILLMLASSVSPQAAGGVSGLITGLGAFTIEVMIVTALYRTLLRFEEPGFLHLRLGGDEVRLLAVWLVLALGALIWVGAAWAFTAYVQREVGTPPAVGVGLLCFAGLVYLAIRLSLAPPATFVTGRIQLARSWRMTRGRVIPLLGMNVLALCLLALTAVVGWFALYMLVGAVSGFRDMGLSSLSDGDALARRPLAALVQGAGELLYGPLFWAISQAPLAAAYKALSADSWEPALHPTP